MKLLPLLISVVLIVVSHIKEIIGFYNKNDVIRSESGIKVGIHERGITLKNPGIISSREGPGRSSGVRLGESRSNVTRYKTAAIIPTPHTTIPPSQYTHSPQISMLNNSNHNVTYLKRHDIPN
ncbi:hypothetical protein KQX54_011820 [Cotesia glomerata]|uniref:Uncharacterized protein n=1 Tax=Cotesia glomerata TaxID=32391 RepID=A0AAV7IHJ4_COTGL|nr:hypothetical protein KQX54_011820 [Cotesia glomerata]